MFQPLFVRSLTDEEKEQLAARCNAPARDESWRAAVILRSAEGEGASEIGRALGFHPSNVKKWIRKFNQEGVAGIAARKRGPREGPRPRFSPEDVARLLDLAASDPASLGLDFEKWTAQKLANAAVERGIVERISQVTVRQVLKRNSAIEVESSSGGSGSIAGLGQTDGSLAAAKRALAGSAYEQAVTHLYKALEEKPATLEEEAEIRVLLSQALAELSKYEEAYRVVNKYEDHQTLATLPARARARAKLRIGWSHSWLGNHPKAIASVNDAKKLFLELQDELGICEAHYALGRIYIDISEFRIARDHLLAAADSQTGASDRELLAGIYLQLGTIDFQEGAFASSKENYSRALDLAEGCAKTNLIGMILLNLGISYNEDDPAEREESVKYNNRAISYLSKGGNKDFLALAYNNLGENLRFSGAWDEATETLRKAIDIARSFSQSRYESTALNTLAEIQCARGNFAEAEENIRKCIQLAESGGDKWLESYALRILAGIHRGSGRIDTALTALRQALRLSTSLGDLHGLTVGQVGLAEAHFLQGGYEQAREYLELAQGRLKEEKSKSLLISGLIQRLAGQLEAASGHLVEARQHIAQSVSIFTTTEMPYEMAKSHHEMALLLDDANDAKGAETHLRQAIEAFQKLGAAPDLQAALHALSRLAAAEPGRASRLPRASYGIAGLSELSGVDSLLHQSRRPSPSVGPKESDVAPDRTALPSDVLLMQRLIEASASHDLLLQELAVIVYENFPVETVIVFREDNGKREPLVVHGIDLSEAERLCDEIDSSLVESGGRSAVMCVVRLISGREDGLGRVGRTFPIVVCVKARSENDALSVFARLQPLIKQAELGLETCSLRSAAQMPAAPSWDHRVKTVMPGFIVGSSSMFDVMEKIHKIRTSDVTVLITGESGTGKELVARALHSESARARAIFLPFNCTATSKDLIDSQLFGHRRGAFTGATANYPGIIKAAEGGTLFLDEIGDVALEVQPKLMRFLQEGEIQPLGETKPLRVDVRVLAATNSDLERAVDEGRFREDLFHRLNIIRIHVPPLRDRAEEVPVLAQHFLDHFSVRSGKQGIKFTQDSIDALTEYEWPGNVRQLRNEIERVVAYAPEGLRVRVQDLSPELSGARKPSDGRSSQSNSRRPSAGNGSDAGASSLKGGSEYVRERNPHEGHRVKLKEATADFERKLIVEALLRNRNNLSRTARDLGFSVRGLRLKLVRLRVDRENLD